MKNRHEIKLKSLTRGPTESLCQKDPNIETDNLQRYISM